MKKYSAQREIIYKTLAENPVHPTAEQLYILVRKELPSVSLATVYRNLNLLKNENSVITFDCEDNKEHFDATVKPHAHFRCSHCGEIEDIFFDDNVLKVLNDLHGGDFKLVYNGICDRCKNKEFN